MSEADMRKVVEQVVGDPDAIEIMPSQDELWQFL